MFASAWNCNRNVIIVVQYIFRLQDYYYYFFLFVLRKLFCLTRRLQDIFKTYFRLFQDVFKTCSCRFERPKFLPLGWRGVITMRRLHFILEVNKFLLGYCLQKFVFALVLQFILFVQYSLFLIQLSLEIPRNLFPASIPCLFI